MSRRSPQSVVVLMLLLEAVWSIAVRVATKDTLLWTRCMLLNSAIPSCVLVQSKDSWLSCCRPEAFQVLTVVIKVEA